MTAETAEWDPTDDADTSGSLPLYAASLVVTLCGVLTVTTELEVADITRVSVLLTLLGYAFSLACRRLQVSPQLVHLGGLALVGFVVYTYVTDRQGDSWFFSQASDADVKLAVAFMWVTVLRSWTLITDDTVLLSSVFTAAIIGLIGTKSVNTETVAYFCLFVVALTFLLIHHNFLQFRTRTLERRRSPAPVLSIQMVLALLTAFVVLALGSVIIVPAQAALANLSLAQAIRQLVHPGRPGEPPPISGANGFRDASHLDIGTGAGWPTGSEVLMHVAPSDNQPHYWRGRTYDVYLGNSWQSRIAMQNDIPISPRVTSDGVGHIYPIPPFMPGEGVTSLPAFPRTPMIASFEVLGQTDQFYYCDEPRSLFYEAEGDGLPVQSPDGHLDLGGRPVRGVYSISSSPPPEWSDSAAVQEKLRHDGTDYPADVRTFYLDGTSGVTNAQDTDDLKRAVAEALQNLPPDRRTPFDEAAAIRDWIAARCTYSLAVSPLPQNADHVHEFLFHTRRGYCDLFASSMVVMCRLAGIPARVATGFAPGERDDRGFNLRALDKHAWAEVYFPGDRWLVFDATVGTRTDGTIPTGSSNVLGFWRRLGRMISRGGPVPTIIIVAIVLLLGYVGKTELYDRWKASANGLGSITDASGGRERLARQYERMARAIGRLGLPRRPSETPDEYEARAVPFLISRQASLGVPLIPSVVSALTDRFIAARYGGQTTSVNPGLDSALTQWHRAAARARRIQAWRRLWRFNRS